MFYNDYAEILVNNYESLTEEEITVLESKINQNELYLFDLPNKILNKNMNKIRYVDNHLCNKEEILNICSSISNITDIDIETAIFNAEIVCNDYREVEDTLKLIKELKK